jgi:hypothetical protein
MFSIRVRAISSAAEVLRRQQRSFLKAEGALSCLTHSGHRSAAACSLHACNRPVAATYKAADTSFKQHVFKDLRSTCQSSSTDCDQQQTATGARQTRSQLKELRSKQHHAGCFTASSALRPLQARGLCSLSSARFRSGVGAAAATSRQQPNSISSSTVCQSMQRRSMQTQRGGGPPLPPWQRLLFNLLGFTVLCVGATLVFTFGSELSSKFIVITVLFDRLVQYTALSEPSVLV